MLASKNVKKNLIVIVLFVPAVLFADDYPELFSVKAGEVFSHPNALQNKDTNRPTTQFRVPNYGASSNLFLNMKLHI